MMHVPPVVMPVQFEFLYSVHVDQKRKINFDFDFDFVLDVAQGSTGA